MSDEIVVSDSSALIGFERIGQLDLLERVFGTVIVPPAVASEVDPLVATQSWLREQPLSRPIPSNVLAASLGPGETEAISLALEGDPAWIVLDELRACRLAESLALPVIGVLGILRFARMAGVVTHVSPLIESLRSTRFYVSERLVNQLLQEFGEDQ